MGIILALFLIYGCSGWEGEQPARCGPSKTKVVEVIDGDTFVISDGTKVRMRMIDAPELHPLECFGEEAKGCLKNMIEGKEVYLSYDDKCIDKYGRILAFVKVDGVDVNKTLVEQGCVCAYPYDQADLPYQVEFKDLESLAKANKQGMWGYCMESECVHPLIK